MIPGAPGEMPVLLPLEARGPPAAGVTLVGGLAGSVPIPTCLGRPVLLAHGPTKRSLFCTGFVCGTGLRHAPCGWTLDCLPACLLGVVSEGGHPALALPLRCPLAVCILALLQGGGTADCGP